MVNKKVDEISGTETTGHEWDGIQELNTPLPRWWLWTFYATIVWAIGYTIAYPAWPMIHSATTGVLGYSSRSSLSEEMKASEALQEVYDSRIQTESLENILADPELRQYAVAGGAAAFKINCVQCHGSGAQGAPGYPNLNDDSWLWGGDINAIHQTIAHGARYESDDDTHISEMPAFGEILEPKQIREVAAYVESLTGTPSDQSLVAPGKEVFAENCASCHGDDAKGDVDFGAPNLADHIWLYGGTEADIVKQVTKPRHGVMPAWQARLGDSKTKQLSVYVHSLGGGQ
jgi:cytochrome c oxidase cbb3-type subunit 3